MLELSKDNFDQEVLKSDIPVIVDFWASWCGPCQAMAPVFEGLAKEYTGKLKFAKMNTENETDLAMKHEIRSIPCLVVFKDGKEVDRIIGFKPEEGLRKEIDRTLANL